MNKRKIEFIASGIILAIWILIGIIAYFCFYGFSSIDYKFIFCIAIYIFVTTIEIMIFKKYTKYDNTILFFLSLLYNFTLAVSIVPVALIMFILGFHVLGALFGEWIFPFVILLYIALWSILLFPMNKLMKKSIKINLFLYIISSVFAIISGIIAFFILGTRLYWGIMIILCLSSICTEKR